jgi:ligand-binding SRPBCC domain-containing protein
MTTIELSTPIAAPPERVFDLARSIDAHQHSTKGTGERAVAGITTGLIGMNEEVTWEARHLGVKRRLTVRVIRFERPRLFQDVMVKGAFKSMRHTHEFIPKSPGTLMIDRFEFESPLGVLGQIMDAVFLRRYMQKFLEKRNQALKQLAESGDWSKFIKPD